jgi:quinol-cytochrome oxidoreductase complex cytochrome b subunit
MVASSGWRSVFRHGYEDTRRNRLLQVSSNIFLHLHPTTTPASGLRFSYTWGLGGLSFLLFILLTLTGVFLMFYYVPDTRRAYDDMKDIEFVVPFGQFLRNLHRWAAHAMVITVWLHMLRVFLTSSYKPPREFNWMIGVMLLVLTLLLSFSGYLLPWDQIAFWAITVGTNMATATPVFGAEGPFSLVAYDNDVRFLILGSRTVGQSALIRFYVLHCLALPLAAAVLVGVHFWRVRKDKFSAPTASLVGGGSGPAVAAEVALEGDPLAAPSKAAVKKTAPAVVEVWPHLVAREFLALVVALLFLHLWSLVVNAPLEEVANPTNTPNPAKAPWYFLGLQEMLVYFDPWIAGVLVPSLIIVGLILLPYLDPNRAGVGYYDLRHRRYATAVFLFGFFLWVGLIIIGQFFRGPGWVWYWFWESWEVHKPVYEKTWDIPWPVGILAIALYFGVGLYLPRRLRPRVFSVISPARYTVLMSLVLTMLAMPIKMILRLVFHVHYVLVTPWFRI